MIVVVAFVLAVCFVGGSLAKSAGDKLRVQLFVMSDCPYGRTAENSIIKTLKALKGYVDFELRFVVSMRGDSLSSLHGQKEIDKNAVQVCVGEVAPDKQLDFVVEWNRDPKQAWQPIASKMKLNAAEIQDCIDSGYAMDILFGDAELCDKLGVRSSPTLLIDGEKYNGKRSSKHFFEAFCKALGKKDKKPKVCDSPPDYLSYSDSRAKGGSCK